MASKPLTSAKKGDKAVIVGWTIKAQRIQKEVTISRVNAKSVSTDEGSRWDYETRRRVGDSGSGYSTTLELWDEEEHPYRARGYEAKALIWELHHLIKDRASNKQLAEILPVLEELKKKLV
jgi:hypothetical protein